MGKEAHAAFLPTLREVKKDEEVEIDFSGVVTFSPSWGDEFITPLVEEYGERLSFLHVKANPSVVLTLELLEKIKQHKFRIVS